MTTLLLLEAAWLPTGWGSKINIRCFCHWTLLWNFWLIFAICLDQDLLRAVLSCRGSALSSQQRKPAQSCRRFSLVSTRHYNLKMFGWEILVCYEHLVTFSQPKSGDCVACNGSQEASHDCQPKYQVTFPITNVQIKKFHLTFELIVFSKIKVAPPDQCYPQPSGGQHG